MPTISLANSIGQPTQEVQAQTIKPRFSPVTVSSSGDVTPAKELPPQGYIPEPTSVPQTAAKDETKPPVKAPPAKTMQDQERMEAIVRREKAMRAKIRESETELAKYKTQVAELNDLKQREEQYKIADQQRKERMDIDLVGYLTEQGYNPDQITQALINRPTGPESPAVKALTEKILKMERDQQEAIKRQESESTANYQNALKTIQGNVDKLVASNPQEFEAIAASEAQASVTSYIEKVWKAEGIMLDHEEAAREIEEYLTDQALGLARLGKVQARLKPAAPKQTAAPAAKPVTLTNAVKQNTRPLTSRERAILAFKRELK
jgi:hypothetical protein